MKKTLLLIKTGHAETFTEESSSGICSLGDVFRTSIIIPLLEEYQVTWLTDSKALDLLKHLSEIKIVTHCNIHHFDIVLNLEKDLNLLDELKSHSNVYGFTNLENLEIRPFLSDKKIFLSDLNKRSTETFQAKLLHIMNLNKDYADYEGFYPINEKPLYRVGLNWKVGPKWPEKALPLSFWEELAEGLGDKNSVSWQEGFDDINCYLKWLSSCETIITLDSLGLHLAVAMKKNIIALFGPTSSNEIELYGRGEKLLYRTEEEKNKLVSEILKKYFKDEV